MNWSKTKKAMWQEFVPSTYTEHLQCQLENTMQESKSLLEYFMVMKKSLRRAGVDDPIWMKFHFMMGSNNNTAKTIFTNTYKSLDDLKFGALKVEQELKAEATRSQAHFAMTKLNDYEHEDGTTKMSKPDEIQDDAPKSDLTAILLGSIDHDESTTTLSEDASAMITTTESLKEHALEASNNVARKDDASIFGGESDDVPSSDFIHGEGDDMVDHGSFPSTMGAFRDESSYFCHHIESASEFTTSPTYDELPQFPCEETHNPHHSTRAEAATTDPATPKQQASSMHPSVQWEGRTATASSSHAHQNG
ncbi:Tyrosyl-tRNA synthetase [Hordeum vulgare]|nr:Tyrosyl-tRNA synthetase [Hordeum vulgare]